MSTLAKVKVTRVMEALAALDEADLSRAEYIECLEEIGNHVDLSLQAAKDDRDAGRPER